MSNIKKQFGFTLVELLIVIVVISILTAITVVSFTGIQQRAANTARTSDMMQVNKLLTLYKATFDIYPAMSATVGAYYCVGTGYANNQCHYNTPESDKTVTNELLKISSSLPVKRMKFANLFHWHSRKLASISSGKAAAPRSRA